MINITVLKNVFIDISIPSFKLNRVITKLTNIIVTSILLLLLKLGCAKNGFSGFRSTVIE